MIRLAAPHTHKPHNCPLVEPPDTCDDCPYCVGMIFLAGNPEADVEVDCEYEETDA